MNRDLTALLIWGVQRMDPFVFLKMNRLDLWASRRGNR